MDQTISFASIAFLLLFVPLFFQFPFFVYLRLYLVLSLTFLLELKAPRAPLFGVCLEGHYINACILYDTIIMYEI